MKKIQEIETFVLLTSSKLDPLYEYDKTTETYDSWNVFDSHWGLKVFREDLTYLSKIINDKKKLAFNAEDNLIHEVEFEYPIFVCGNKIFESLFEDEEDDILPLFQIANNKEEFKNAKKYFDELIYIFSFKDDIYEKALEYLEKEQMTFEKKIMTPVEMKGTILITDPCYLLSNTPDDYNSYDLTSIGLSTFISRDTLYGDWSCHTFTPDGKVLGQFCADSGMVCVCLYEEVLNINPEFDEWLNNHSHAGTIIKDFDGFVKFTIDEMNNNELSVIGTGNIEFYTRQTGF